MQTLNFIACMILFGLSTWAILSSHFSDGLLLKKGLILAALSGFAGLAHYYTGNYDANAQAVFTNLSFALVLLSMVWRRITRPIWAHK